MKGTFKFQVMVTDKTDYIIEYKNFTNTTTDMSIMLDYLRLVLNDKSAVSKVTITKWKLTGERV